ncbi:N-acetylneuraminate synthase family protein [Pseudodesulfovibrio sp.]|uniref:N-acetylneuraminate synthase family protein n=1 Tax=Pseudodesulfovibrio sp. TaxID=2035812 RepID=UPI00262E2086|nr:N-acetylneuraminate synthase family protein [Pseudodesulfovibrio sp.]MDD3312393.1 N-acetylneuraminate synthase family protein [Pseudodesulfovibrio sp.]
MEFRIGKAIASEDRTMVIAEAGVNHLGRMDYAEKLIASAKRAGADMIKFQTYKAARLTTRNAPRFWNWEGEHDKEGSQYDSYSILDSFGKEEHRRLKEMCDAHGIEFLSTPFDNEAVDMLVEIGVNGFKIASCDINNIPFLEYVASKGLPILLSTGASSMEDIRRAVEVIHSRGNDQVCVMHCTLCYPTEPKDANLRAVLKLQEAFPDKLIGFSDHTLGTVVASASVLYGVRAIEKHYTFDKTLPDSADHWLSLDEADLARLVADVRTLEAALGTGGKAVLDCERPARSFARRSLVAARDLPKGSVLEAEDVVCKRPGTGIPPTRLDEFVGKTLARDVVADALFETGDFGE